MMVHEITSLFPRNIRSVSRNLKKIISCFASLHFSINRRRCGLIFAPLTLALSFPHNDTENICVHIKNATTLKIAKLIAWR
jgi:hypothetical protein